MNFFSAPVFSSKDIAGHQSLLPFVALQRCASLALTLSIVASIKPLQNQAEGITPEEQRDATKSLLAVQSPKKTTRDGIGNSTAVKTVIGTKIKKPTDDRTRVSTPISGGKQEDENNEKGVETTFSSGRSEDRKISRRSIVDSGLNRGSRTSQGAKRRFKKARVLPSEDLVDGRDVRNAGIPGSSHSHK